MYFCLLQFLRWAKGLSIHVRRDRATRTRLGRQCTFVQVTPGIKWWKSDHFLRDDKFLLSKRIYEGEGFSILQPAAFRSYSLFKTPTWLHYIVPTRLGVSDPKNKLISFHKYRTSCKSSWGFPQQKKYAPIHFGNTITNSYKPCPIPKNSSRTWQCYCCSTLESGATGPNRTDIRILHSIPGADYWDFQALIFKQMPECFGLRYSFAKNSYTVHQPSCVVWAGNFTGEIVHSGTSKYFASKILDAKQKQNVSFPCGLRLDSLLPRPLPSRNSLWSHRPSMHHSPFRRSSLSCWGYLRVEP